MPDAYLELNDCEQFKIGWVVTHLSWEQRGEELSKTGAEAIWHYFSIGSIAVCA